MNHKNEGRPQDRRLANSFPARIYVGSVAGVMAATPAGSNWEDINRNLRSVTINALTTSGGVAIAATLGGIYKTADAGDHGTRNFDVAAADFARQGSTILALVYYSQENGMHWAKPEASVAVGNAPARVLADNGTFYISYGHVLLRSADGGANWDAETVPSTVENITGLSVANGIPILGGEISGPIGQPPVYKVFRRGADGWHAIDLSAPEGVSFGNFVVSGDQVLAGSVDNSVWRVPLSTITGSAGVDVAGHAATGLGAFPNPASSEITIVFTTPSNGDARVTISDATGREVATLHDGFLTAGVHMLRWNVAGFPNGAYFYKIASNGRVNTGTLIKNDR